MAKRTEIWLILRSGVLEEVKSNNPNIKVNVIERNDASENDTKNDTPGRRIDLSNEGD